MLASYVLSFDRGSRLARYLLKDHDDGQPKGMGARLSAALRPRLRSSAARPTVADSELSLQRRQFVLGCFGLLVVVNRTSDACRSAPTSSRVPTSASCKLHVRAPARNAHRGDREHRRRRRAARSARSSRRESCARSTSTDRRTVLLQPRLRADRQHQRHGRRHSDCAQAGHTSRRSNTCALFARSCPTKFPGSLFYFQTADIVSQVLNFGLSAPIDVQIEDQTSTAPTPPASGCCRRCSEFPASSTCASLQVLDYPGAPDRRRPAARGPARPRAARRRQQHADLAVGQLAGRPVLSSSIRRTT